MLTQEEQKNIAHKIFTWADSEESELIFKSHQTFLTRMGNNEITQNVSKTEDQLTIRLLSGQKSSRVALNQFGDKELKESLQNARKLLEHTTSNDKLLPLLKTKEEYQKVQGSFETTKIHSPKEKAEEIQPFLKESKKKSYELSGTYSTSINQTTYANSHGIFIGHPQSIAMLSMTLSDRGTESSSQIFHHNIEKLSPKIAFQKTLERAEGSKNPKFLAPGKYTVVLEKGAVAELVAFLNMMGSSALAFHENRTYHAKKLGEPFFSPKFNMTENVYHPEICGLPFDMEGVPRKKVSLIEKGVPVNVVYDRPTANIYEKKTTGHSLEQPNSAGPVAENIVVSGESNSLDDLIGSTSEGLLVCKLHYIRIQDFKHLVLTGMTRAGLFWIQDGKIAYPVKNLRFTISLLDVFNQIEALGQSMPARWSPWGGRVIAPPMKIKEFQFSSTTDK